MLGWHDLPALTGFQRTFRNRPYPPKNSPSFSPHLFQAQGESQLKIFFPYLKILIA